MVIVSIALCLIGILLALLSLHSNHKTVCKSRLIYAGISITALLIGGWIIIQQIYAKQTPPLRIFQKHLETDYHTRPLDLSRNSTKEKTVA
jgi:hypothetical protein